MRSRAEFIQQKTDSILEQKNESRRPANAERRLSDLFTPGFSPGDRRLFTMRCAMSFAPTFAAVHAAVYAAVYATEGAAISFLPVPDLQLAV
jgi:hypothetical protein